MARRTKCADERSVCRSHAMATGSAVWAGCSSSAEAKLDRLRRIAAGTGAEPTRGQDRGSCACATLVGQLDLGVVRGLLELRNRQPAGPAVLRRMWGGARRDLPLVLGARSGRTRSSAAHAAPGSWRPRRRPRPCRIGGGHDGGEARPSGPRRGHAPPSAERRLVSVLFADLVGFTPFAEERDAEDVREMLSRYFELASRRHRAATAARSRSSSATP